MITYTFSTPIPSSHYIEIEMLIDNLPGDELILQLPSWRPGRYELGNFARNIQKFKVMDAEASGGNEIPFQKITKDCWKVSLLRGQGGNRSGGEARILYNYYAFQPDAGGCLLDESQLYVNPVHCCLFIPGRMHEEHRIRLNIPAEYKVACSMNQPEKNILSAKDFDELADSPFIASPSLQHDFYEVNKVKFHFWLQGSCKPEWNKLKEDFKNFTEVQLTMMNDFPFDEYHFLVLALPNKFYHGVEHLKSTVLALGPAHELMEGELYNELMGVASHELFHTWNVKTIRPADMLPYAYTKENYSRLGWVYEGFTTYYGDLFLVRSGFFSAQQFLDEISVRLQKHLDNYGRFNYSVAQSSFDTWLDGYVAGVPWRKTSIYDEGSLIAMMLDLMIRLETKYEKSLDDVMRSLYNDFGKQNIGYREKDVKILVENMLGRKADDFFARYINGTISYDSLFAELFKAAGGSIQYVPAKNMYETKYGFKILQEQETARITLIAPGSPAEQSGLSRDDEIISVNGMKLENNLNDLSALSEKEITLELFRNRELITKTLVAGVKEFFPLVKLSLNAEADEKQKKFIAEWMGNQKEISVPGFKKN